MNGASWPEPGQVFLFDGDSSVPCPLCHLFIAKDHSPAMRLPAPLQMRCTPDRRRSRDTGELYHSDGRPVSPGHRWFVHERCWPRYGKALASVLWWEPRLGKPWPAATPAWITRGGAS